MGRVAEASGPLRDGRGYTEEIRVRALTDLARADLRYPGPRHARHRLGSSRAGRLTRRSRRGSLMLW